MDFFDYIFGYYTAKLEEYESLEITALGREELLHILAEASALKKFMYDNKEEGYEDTYDEFCQRLDAVGRLERFIARGLTLTGGREEEMFYLYPHRLRDDFSTDGFPVKVQTLDSFLKKLEALRPKDLDQNLLHRYASPRWLEKTQVVIQEMAAYTVWVISQARQEASFLCLLRDALIPYLGLKQSKVDASPLLLSRKFFAPWGNVFYKNITPPIYDIASKAPEATYTQLRAEYKRLLLACSEQPLLNAIAAAREYVAAVADPAKTYTVIESGVQGSMPLFAGAISENINGFLMYTTAPWLLKQYKDIVFRPNYNYLREMETLVCQNYLFDFHSYRDGKIYIQEYQDPKIQTLARYELLVYWNCLSGC